MAMTGKEEIKHGDITQSGPVQLLESTKTGIGLERKQQASVMSSSAGVVEHVQGLVEWLAHRLSRSATI
ncbi:hypothetical protein N7532_000541 [Penicillium argentinense]|uniref:Uncharacterized protein n=1 Tax=Penicillium argentinense TaxID=1131581 RepID=A0A9W9G5I5_9EURO|nr:uncharacterized protein N7532_000541 [Penicillium argentinense]KAJ5112496.1 hypothetical protein N7532_000541 [Penicillium argentinense]